MLAKLAGNGIAASEAILKILKPFLPKLISQNHLCQVSKE
jgi:hypothetical protein